MINGLDDLRLFASSSRTPLGQLIFLAVALLRGLTINGLRYRTWQLRLGDVWDVLHCTTTMHFGADANATFDKKIMPKNDGARKPEWDSAQLKEECKTTDLPPVNPNQSPEHLKMHYP